MRELFDDYKERTLDWVDSLNFSSAHKRALLVLAIVVVLLSFLVVSRGHSAPVMEPLPVVVELPQVVVDVAGAVKSPGIYSLPANSRVADAVEAAGGPKAGANTSEINLARIIKDGEQIYVEPRASKTSIFSQGHTSVAPTNSGPININRASSGELEILPGIGPVLASRIVDYRKANGPFLTIEELENVSGIGSATFAHLKSKVRV